MNKRFLFLDIDGVLNSEKFFKDFKIFNSRQVHLELDPEAIERLNKIIEMTNCLIVISSTWRLPKERDDIWFNKHLSQFGFKHGFRIIGKTPRIAKQGEEEIRGTEIQAWMDDRMKPIKENDIVILDDDSDMAHLINRLVHTSWKLGLQDEHIQMVEDKFNEN